MKKIVLVGLIHDTNIGDKVIYDNTQYLVKKALKELEIEDAIIESIDMTGAAETKQENASSQGGVKNKIRQYANKILTPELKSKIRYMLSKSKNSDEDKLLHYYEENLKDADLVIFVGGGIIKYLYQDFYRYISLMIETCEKFGTDVSFNSVGIEKYSQKDARCQRLKKALNKPCVKMITTRDDFNLLKNHYIENPAIKIEKVADPAVWSYQTYAENRKNKPSEKIGLGVIRPGIFKDNGIRFSEEKQIELWVKIIEELERKGYSWKLFTNGMYSDYEFAKKILETKNIKAEEKLVDMPKNGEELIQIISEFKGVIAARMHANIIAYSLDIPSVGIVWNDKLKMFGENIQQPERFVTHENFNAKYIVESLEKALKDGYHVNKEDYQQTVYASLKKGIENTLIKNKE